MIKEPWTYNRELTASSTTGVNKTDWTAVCKRVKLDYCLPLYTKVNLKWIKDPNVRHETIKLLDDNTGKIS